MSTKLWAVPKGCACGWATSLHEVLARIIECVPTARRTAALDDGHPESVHEIRRRVITLRQWQPAFVANFDTSRPSTGGTGAVNGLIELQRCTAQGFPYRGNYRLRMIPIAGGLTNPRLR